ncbi:hypothetical protein Pr1d_03460 [Bythopirellula goksoeyrii]|uniref:Uncharacterized protein n=1 Tax=Bythopirellula goksoeyrii TaxID=1400387 RepID=A0A5B9Q6C9_9BACT|nr:hypothetical protein Pr1d_03460 [Bythopirellula goksoeyrii]
MDREGGVVDRRHASRETWPTGMVTILVPPAVFQKVQAVFYSPVLANVPQEIGGGDLIGIKAAHIVASIMQNDFAIIST